MVSYQDPLRITDTIQDPVLPGSSRVIRFTSGAESLVGPVYFGSVYKWQTGCTDRQQAPRKITPEKLPAKQLQPANYVPREAIHIVHAHQWTQRLVRLLLLLMSLVSENLPDSQESRRRSRRTRVGVRTYLPRFQQGRAQDPRLLEGQPQRSHPRHCRSPKQRLHRLVGVRCGYRHGRWLTEIQGDSRDLGVLGRQVRQGPQTLQHRPGQVH